ncbi:hypothetical protein L210DRAFT_3546765 [Boletus edulis BED1]|uniref:Uncharacterized protein n=1 Tax=Boletus edulis BED1 TaxID=1328754 RepID=A0AAD4BQT4_BOLED|nr:hypothetical protein L210DRAFT_3546765 [Boletus edulis BED1]
MVNSPAPTHEMDSDPNHAPTSALKRRIAALEEENAQLSNKLIRTPIHSWVREGRVIRRLVSIADLVTDLIAEYDRRLMLVDDSEDIELVESTDEEQRTFRSLKKLLTWSPTLKNTMPSHTELALVCYELKKGADGARADDTNSLKHSVANWLNEQQPPPSPLLPVNDKQGRGFDHDLTGSLLCPIDFNWLDIPIRTAIRDYHPRYAVTAHMWPSFLYAKGRGDPESPSEGLFKGELLVRAFRCIFTSPGSSRREIENDAAIEPQGPPSKRQRTRCDVAGLLKMRSVQPRAIAYIAVQVRFALSSNAFWTLKDDNFDYEIFYHNIVDWFELPTSAAKSQEIDRLLRWWNRMIFGRRNASTLEPQDVAALSVARSKV